MTASRAEIERLADGYAGTLRDQQMGMVGSTAVKMSKDALMVQVDSLIADAGMMREALEKTRDKIMAVGGPEFSGNSYFGGVLRLIDAALDSASKGGE